MVRLALKIFCRKIEVNDKHRLAISGPVLITANHPNSFFDAILVGALFKRPVYFLTRGDAFVKPWHAKMLHLLNMIPIYRMSEGKVNLSRNESAFQRSKEILKAGGLVLIFIEGICVNKHELQPFKKGAARIASESKMLARLNILPLSIAYHSFHRFGKIIKLNIAAPIDVNRFFGNEEESKNTKEFNEVLFEVIGKNISIPKDGKPVSATQKIILAIPAAVGFAIHIIPYLIIKKTIQKKTAGTVFYDSVLFGALLLAYPILLLLVCSILLFCKVALSMIIVLFITTPLFAWSAVAYRRA